MKCQIGYAILSFLCFVSLFRICRSYVVHHYVGVVVVAVARLSDSVVPVVCIMRLWQKCTNVEINMYLSFNIETSSIVYFILFFFCSCRSIMTMISLVSSLIWLSHRVHEQLPFHCWETSEKKFKSLITFVMHTFLYLTWI